MSKSSVLPLESEFWAFAESVPLASRDTSFGPITPFGTQRRLIREIFDGLHKGVHQFLVCKAGQVGASTILQLLTLFWYRHSPGLQGVMVTDSDELREFFRDQFTLMATHGETEHVFRLNNKNQIAWDNGSRLLFQTSGARTGVRLGVGRGFAFCHGTEVSLWKQAGSLTYLRTRFSKEHPHRLLVLESTARGKNWWFDLWTDAEESVDIKRIFLAWWMREDYTVTSKSPEFEKYWDGRFTLKERHWANELKRRYQVTLTHEQWAWRRWYLAETAGNDHRLADQEMPTLPEDSFEASGECFLGHELVKRCRKTVKTAGRPKAYRYDFGSHLEETEVQPTTQAMGELLVWEEPKDGEAYIIAAVPAHSATPECATSVASVWRATRDELEQVAECASPRFGLQTFSWVCLHLLGIYQVARRAFILEVAGAGMGVLQDMKRLQQSNWGMKMLPRSRQIVGPIHHYLWRRPDSLSGSVALQWKSDATIQGWVIRRLRDQLESGAVRLRSEATLGECERMRSQDDKFVSDGRVCEEHRLMAAALAVESWSAQVRPLFRQTQGNAKATTVLGRTVENFFSQLAVR